MDCSEGSGVEVHAGVTDTVGEGAGLIPTGSEVPVPARPALLHESRNSADGGVNLVGMCFLLLPQAMNVATVFKR